MNNTELLECIHVSEHILDSIIPDMLASDEVLFYSNKYQLMLRTPEAIKAVADALGALSVKRLEQLENDAGIRTKQIKIEALIKEVQQ